VSPCRWHKLKPAAARTTAARSSAARSAPPTPRIYFYRNDFINNFTSAINTRDEVPNLTLSPTANCGEFEGTGQYNTYTGPIPLTLVQSDVLKVRVKLVAINTWNVYWQNITLGTAEALHGTFTGNCSGFAFSSTGPGRSHPNPTRHHRDPHLLGWAPTGTQRLASGDGVRGAGARSSRSRPLPTPRPFCGSTRKVTELAR
jgi:hypothetical protein